jgi:hypothetical protein
MIIVIVVWGRYESVRKNAQIRWVAVLGKEGFRQPKRRGLKRALIGLRKDRQGNWGQLTRWRENNT